jgi:MFS transporter, BCD family, chlorophyll transporter
LQDGLLEVFGAEVFGLRVGETARFTQSWNVGALIGMLVMGALTGFWRLPRRGVTALGSLLVALGLGGLAVCAAQQNLAPLSASIGLMGLGAGVFNIGALTMMLAMTTAEERGTYMGLWGMAQALGMGLASLLAGAAHTAFIERLALPATSVYAGFFVAEAAVMLLALVALRFVGTGLGELTQAELTQTLAIEGA